MLTSICRALNERLSQLGVPFYLEDCVPPGTSFPYITADVRAPLAPHANGRLTLTFWCQGDTASSHRLSQADLLLKQFPARGLRLETASGAAILRQEGGAVCVREAAAQGVKITWKLQFFPKK